MILGLASGLSVPTGGLASFSYDSFRYLAGAESIRQRGLYQDLDGRMQNVWPPGLSLLYAAVSRLTATPAQDLVRAINVVSYIVAVAAVWGTSRAAGLPGWAQFLIVAACAVNGALLSMSNKLWSDLPAMSLMLVGVFLLLQTVMQRSVTLFLLANTVVALGIMLRYAMLAAVPLLLVISLFVIRRERRFVWLVLVPLMTPLPMLIASATLGTLQGRTRGLTPRTVPWLDNWAGLLALADQMFPVRYLGAASVLALLAAGVVAPLFVVQRSPVVALCQGWIFVYGGFLLFAQAFTEPSFAIDIRILLPLYPAMLISAGAAAAGLIREKQRFRRVGAVLIMVALAMASARAVRFATQTVVGGWRADEHMDCVSREVYVAGVQASSISSHVLSNAQGIVWYALRRPVQPLTAAMVEAAPSGTTVVYVDPARACPGAVESTVLAVADLRRGDIVEQQDDGLVILQLK